MEKHVVMYLKENTLEKTTILYLFLITLIILLSFKSKALFSQTNAKEELVASKSDKQHEDRLFEIANADLLAFNGYSSQCTPGAVVPGQTRYSHLLFSESFLKNSEAVIERSDIS